MSNNNGKDVQHSDLIEGFKILDENLLERNAPKIQWGGLWKQRSHEDQIKYLQNLASTMNHAAWLIQEERNQLITICETKDAQLKTLQVSIEQNNDMLQTELVKMNERGHVYKKEIARLNIVIRELESGNID